MSPADQYDACVVGLGPTGLLLAHLLAERGVRVLVLEREPTYYGMARAVYTDDECLRILQTAGVADDVHADMVVDLPVQWVRADRSVLMQFHDPSRRNGWPTSNFFYQPFFEETLERRLADRQLVTARRGRAVLSVAQDDEGVTVTHQGCRGAAYGRGEADLIEGTVETTRVPYLVAADPVRGSAGRQVRPGRRARHGVGRRGPGHRPAGGCRRSVVAPESLVDNDFRARHTAAGTTPERGRWGRRDLGRGHRRAVVGVAAPATIAHGSGALAAP
ncbi:MAG: FAD-dependent monooxygenase [Tetrasphaera sp.]